MYCVNLIILIILKEMYPTLVLCQQTKIQGSDENDVEQKFLLKLFGAISRAKETEDGRKYGKPKNNQLKLFINALSNTLDVAKYKTWLRQEAEGNEEEVPLVKNEELAGLVEKELLHALSKKSSALLDKPYVQKKGRNDFLVIRTDLRDPFVTVVPNDIYYNVEKKCINWLQDCNQKGLRERLLQKVNSPYK